jgi:hypothetical protein
MTGAATVIADYNGFASSVKASGFSMVNNYQTNEITMPVYLFNGNTAASNGGPGDDMSSVVFESGYLRDASQASNAMYSSFLGFDGHMPVGTFVGPQKFDRYEYGPNGSTVKHAVIDITANYTHYGQHVDATLIVPASVTGFTITLAATMGATGNEPVATGNRVYFIRQSGTASGTVLIKDAAGTTLATNTANAHLSFRFNGSQYVALTPVT